MYCINFLPSDGSQVSGDLLLKVQLVLAVKKELTKEEKNILFIKWDKFSRNIQYA